MSVLVAYVSKHGSTRGIAESMAEALRQRGAQVDLRPVGKVANLEDYEGFVIGSAVYYGFWRREAKRFIRRNRTVLTSLPVWLFSSGPLGTKITDPQGRDLRSAAEPKVTAEFRTTIAPRDHHAFFGALDLSKLGITERFVTKWPASRELLPEGDFRDQPDIHAWATGIAQAVEATQAAPH